MTDRTYRCLNCLDETVDRGYDVSHIKVTCDACGEFSRFVQERVYQQFADFEASPPEGLPWDRLERTQKFLVAEKTVRRGKSIEDFDIDLPEEDVPPADVNAEAADEAETDEPDADHDGGTAAVDAEDA